MRRALTLAMAIGLTGCTCAGSTPAEDAAEVGSKAKKKPVRGERPDGPVMRRAEFVIPIVGFTDEDVPALRQVVLDALAEADPNNVHEAEDEAQPWSCRTAHTWALRGEDASTISVWERYPNPECTGTVEKWWVEVDQISDDKPKSRAPKGTAKLQSAGKRMLREDTVWLHQFETIHELEGAQDEGPWPHDVAWLGEQLDEGVGLGADAQMISQRWALARVNIAGEKLMVEADRWTCGDPTQPTTAVGAALRFRTNRRAAGHSARHPKDVVVVNRVQSFADAIATKLGERAGGQDPTQIKVLTCP